MKVRTFIISFTCEKVVKGTPDKLRGFFADRFNEYSLLHNHLDGKKFLYSTPRIQYKILYGYPFVIGIEEGFDILKSIYDEIDYLNISGSKYSITQKNIVIRTDEFGLANELVSYTFLTPWLALNEKNYEKYMMMGDWKQRKELLEKILVGNIISISKSLGYTVDKPIITEIKRFKEVKTRLKKIKMLAFLGTFSVNFEIPDFWGVGKSVSRGFGTIKKLY